MAMRWSLRLHPLPPRWLDPTSEYGPLPGVLLPTLRGLTPHDSPMYTTKTSVHQPGYPQPSSVSSLCGMGLDGNGTIGGVPGVVDDRLMVSLPPVNPAEQCTWLLAGMVWIPCATDPAYVAGMSSVSPPVISYPSWDQVMVSAESGGVSLTAEQEALSKRIFLGLLYIGLRADPLFWKKGYETRSTTTPDPFLLPVEGHFFLQAALQWLQQVLVERRLPAATFHAWVGTSALAQPRSAPDALALEVLQRRRWGRSGAPEAAAYQYDSWARNPDGTSFPWSAGRPIKPEECVEVGLEALRRIAVAGGMLHSGPVPTYLPILGDPTVRFEAAAAVQVTVASGAYGVPGVNGAPGGGSGPAPSQPWNGPPGDRPGFHQSTYGPRPPAGRQPSPPRTSPGPPPPVPGHAAAAAASWSPQPNGGVPPGAPGAPGPSSGWSPGAPGPSTWAPPQSKPPPPAPSTWSPPPREVPGVWEAPADASPASSAVSSSPARREDEEDWEGWQCDWSWRYEAAQLEKEALELQRGLSAATVQVRRLLAFGPDTSRWQRNLDLLKEHLPASVGSWKSLMNVVGVLPSFGLTSISYKLDIQVKYFDGSFPFTYAKLQWPRGAAEALAPGLNTGVPGVEIPPVEVVAWSNNKGAVIGPAPTLYSSGRAAPDGQVLYMQSLRQYFLAFPVQNGEVQPPRKLPGEPKKDLGVTGVPDFEAPVRWHASQYDTKVEKAKVGVTADGNNITIMEHVPRSLLYIDVPGVGMVPIGVVLANAKNNFVHLWHCSLVTSEIADRAELSSLHWRGKPWWHKT